MTAHFFENCSITESVVILICSFMQVLICYPQQPDFYSIIIKIMILPFMFEKIGYTNQSYVACICVIRDQFITQIT